MMSENAKKLRIMFLAVFMVAFFLTNGHGLEASAAAKTTVSISEDGIGINGSCKVELKNKNAKAKYIYTSSNKKVAVVSREGNVRGVAAGTAKIKVTQVLNGKKTTVGTVKVAVKKAVIDEEAVKYSGEVITTLPGIYGEDWEDYHLAVDDYVKYKNPKAVYQFFSTDEEKLVITPKGYVEEANEAGIVKIKLKETYKEKTRTVGTFEVEVKDPALGENCTLNPVVPKGEIVRTDDFVSNIGRYFVLVTDSAAEPTIDNYEQLYDEVELLSFVYDENGEWTGELRAEEVGTEYVHFWAYDYVKEEYSIYLGYATIKIADSSVLEDFIFPWEEADFFEYDEEEGLVIYKDKSNYMYLKQTPWYYTKEYTVTSSNPEIVTGYTMNIVYLNYPREEYPGRVYLFLEATETGTATITVEAEGIRREFKVTIKEALEEDGKK